MFNFIKEEVRAIKERDPAARNAFEIIFMYSGFHAVCWHRLSHWLYVHKRYSLARYVSQSCRFWTGIEIHPGAKIGKGLFIDHGMGVVIGETTEIGDNVTIYQGVTLGGTGKETGKRHPTIGNNVMIGCGAKVLGPFYVGDNSKIASNAVVLSEVPANSTCVGVPARVVKINDQRIGPQDLDQIHVPDPVAQQLGSMEDRIAQLEKMLQKVEEKQDENI
ncbi:MAG: serine O-acetyltransferase [Clostridia bacterium]|nr:serine O-acetyltransferase [Clostridia bacterium]